MWNWNEDMYHDHEDIGMRMRICGMGMRMCGMRLRCWNGVRQELSEVYKIVIIGVWEWGWE